MKHAYYTFKQRRSGKNRRKYVDPRYRNPDYPEFCDRRKAQRRKPIYEDCRPFLEEHPNRKWVAVVSIVAAIFLLYVFILTSGGVSKSLGTKKIGNVNRQVFPYMLQWSF
jgi:hypothetical protein